MCQTASQGRLVTIRGPLAQIVRLSKHDWSGHSPSAADSRIHDFDEESAIYLGSARRMFARSISVILSFCRYAVINY